MSLAESLDELERALQAAEPHPTLLIAIENASHFLKSQSQEIDRVNSSMQVPAADKGAIERALGQIASAGRSCATGLTARGCFARQPDPTTHLLAITTGLLELRGAITAAQAQEALTTSRGFDERITRVAMAAGLLDIDIQSEKDALMVHIQGDRLRVGLAAPKSSSMALQKYLQAAKWGYGPSLVAAGQMLSSGEGCIADPERSLRFIRQAVDIGYPQGQVTMAEFLLTGWPDANLEKDEDAAEALLRLAIAKEDPEAYLRLGILYNGKADVAAQCHVYNQRVTKLQTLLKGARGFEVRELKDSSESSAQELYVTSRRYFESAAGKGIDEAHNNLGVLYMAELAEGTHEMAFQAFYKGHEHGDIKSRVHLGICYEEGIGCDVAPHRALQFYTMAANAFNNKGRVGAASLHLGNHRYDEALQLLRAAVDGGDASACRILGSVYISGDGVPVDRGVARQLFQIGAERGDLECHLLLAEMLTAINEDSRPILEKAAKLGSGDAMRALGSIPSESMQMRLIYMQDSFIAGCDEVIEDIARLLLENVSSATADSEIEVIERLLSECDAQLDLHVQLRMIKAERSHIYSHSGLSLTPMDSEPKEFEELRRESTALPATVLQIHSRSRSELQQQDQQEAQPPSKTSQRKAETSILD